MASKQDIAYQQGLNEADPILKIFDYDVLDKTGGKVGTVNNTWPERDQSGIAFLGVRTGWLFGRDHVIPAHSMRVNHDDRTVTLPLARDEIKQAPDFNLAGEFNEEDSIRV